MAGTFRDAPAALGGRASCNRDAPLFHYQHGRNDLGIVHAQQLVSHTRQSAKQSRLPNSTDCSPYVPVETDRRTLSSHHIRAASTRSVRSNRRRADNRKSACPSITQQSESLAVAEFAQAVFTASVTSSRAAARSTVTHTYAEPGAYTVTVRATDVAGYIAAGSIAVDVAPPPAIPVTVTASPSDPVAGEAVTFTVEVSPPDNAAAVRDVTIDFGDDSRGSLGALSGRRSIAHVYEDEDSYIVTVRVLDATDRRHRSSIGLTVRPAPGITVTITASPAATG